MWCSTSSCRDHGPSGTCPGLRRSKSSLSIQRPQLDFLSCGRPVPSQALLADPSCHWAGKAHGGQRRAKTPDSRIAPRCPWKGKRVFPRKCVHRNSPRLHAAAQRRLYNWHCGTVPSLIPAEPPELKKHQKQELSYLPHSVISYLLSDIFHKYFLPPSKFQHSTALERVLLCKRWPKTAACVVLPTDFTAEMENEFLSGRGVRKAVGSPLRRTQFWGFPLHISMISSEVLPKTAVLQHQSRRKPHCYASVWLLYQSSRVLQNTQSLALIKYQCH